jgi:hypothetical protein
MAGQFGESGIGMTFNIARHVERVQPVDADQQDVVDIRRVRGCNEGCAGQQAEQNFS